MKRFLIIFLIVFNAIQIIANTNNPDIEAANKAYNKEKFNDAINLYNKVLANGMESADLYFNLGNCYYRLNNFPLAILNYERAKKLDPADADIDMNLKIANTKIIDKIETVPQLFFIKWWILLSNLFSYDDWAIISIVAIFGFFISLFIYLASHTYRLKKFTFWLGISMLLITLFSVHFALRQYNDINSSNHAIIFSPTVTVKSSPDEKAADKFVIHEGTKVEILDELNNWVKIKIANGSNGWVDKQSFEII